MRLDATLMGTSLLGTGLVILVACSPATGNPRGNGSGAGNGNTPNAGASFGGAPVGGNGTTLPGAGNAGTGTGGAASGGTGNPGGGAAGTPGGAGMPGEVTCTNADKSTLPIDESGWIARECNDRGIQGPFYCYDDGVNPSGCPAGMPPWRAGGGMCLQGSTTPYDSTVNNWGAGIGLGLNESGGEASDKMAYDAAGAGVLGFQVEITGDTGGLPIRVNFKGQAGDTESISPFFQLPGAGSYEVPIADALVPVAWMVPESGTTPNANSIFDVQFQVAAGTVAANYDFCISSLKPITDGSEPIGGTLMPYGSQQCSNFAEIGLGNRYMVQNNLYNAQGGNQCVTAAWDNGANVGFTVNPVSLNVATGGAPASYPSIVLGWHVNGQMYGSYTSARRISAITSAPTSWTFTVPGDGRYNASYDIWLHNSNAQPPNDQGTLELMIWLNQRDTTPIGQQVGQVMIGGQNWVVWYGPNVGFNTVSYIRPTNTTSVTNLDLKPFFSDAAMRGYINDDAYMLGIQAGFEIWQVNQSLVTNSFTASVN